MLVIGEVNKVREREVEWRIPDFLSLPEHEDEWFISTAFSCAGEKWFLKIFPNGESKKNSLGHVGLYLIRYLYGPPVCATFSLAVKTTDGEKDHQQQETHVFNDFELERAFPRFLKRSTLLEKRCRLLPSDTFTVVCTFHRPGVPDDAAGSDETGSAELEKSADGEDVSGDTETSEDEENSEDEESSEDEMKGEDKGFSKITLAKAKKINSLVQDYKKVLLHGKNHDLIFKIGDIELRAHQDILRARSHVFESMLHHEMKEKKSGVIDVPDCDPQAMEQFLTYMYCGSVSALDESNMLGLYYIADKYDSQDLKEECRDFIKESFSITNICDVILLALKHSDDALLEHATEYFTNNTLDIMHTVEWQVFLKDNSTVGNELLIKSFKKSKE